MASVTLSTLQTRVRQRADLENSTFVADAELTTHINASWGELYDLLVATGAGYFATSGTFTMTGSSIDLVATAPGANLTTFYQLIGLDYQDGGSGTGYTAVPRAEFNDRNKGMTRSYYLMGTTLYVVPPELAPGNYRAWYYPLPTALSSGTDAITGHNSWEEYVVVDAAIKCMTKAEQDPAPLFAEKAALKARIEGMAQMRDQNAPPAVRDTRATVTWWPRY